MYQVTRIAYGELASGIMKSNCASGFQADALFLRVFYVSSMRLAGEYCRIRLRNTNFGNSLNSSY
jgi:hypothetical protein